MADVAQLDIIIGANVQSAIAGLEHLSDELTQLSKGGVTSIEQLNRAMDTLRQASLKATDVGQLAKYNKAIEALAGEATKLKNVGLGEGLAKIKPGADQATNSLTNLGRVVQDAPFGFMAIANNLNPLLESFQRLGATAKETGQSSIKLFTQSLIGPAGLGIALSVVSSILIKYPDLLSTVSEEAAKAAKKQKDYNEAMASSIAPAQTQITTLNSLLSIARDSSQSLQTQKNAIAEINRLYPERLGFLNKENIDSQNAKQAIDALTNSLLLQAQAQAATNLLTKAYEDLSKAQNANASDYVTFLDAMFTGMKNFGSITGSVQDLQAKGAKEQKKSVGDAQKDVETYTKLLTDLQQKLAQTGGFTIKPPKTEKGKSLADVFKELNNELKFIGLKEGAEHVNLTTEKINALEGALKQMVQINAPLKDMIDIIRQIQVLKAPIDFAETQKNISKQLPIITRTVKEGLNKQFKDLKGFDPMGDIFEMGDITNEKIKKRNKENADLQKESLEKAMKAAGQLQGVFENVFSSLADGGQNAVQTLIHSLEQLIIKLAAAAAAAALIQFLFNPMQGGKALGFAGIFQGLLGFQHGGIVTGPTAALIGEAGPEVVLPLDKLRDFIKPAYSAPIVLETRISGNDLYLIQSRTQQRRGRTY